MHEENLGTSPNHRQFQYWLAFCIQAKYKLNVWGNFAAQIRANVCFEVFNTDWLFILYRKRLYVLLKYRYPFRKFIHFKEI